MRLKQYLGEAIKYPTTLKSKDDNKNLVKVEWKKVSNGDIVYLYAKFDSGETGIGPFKVVNAKDRKLVRTDSTRDFIHYPEELYKAK